jgi:transposase
LELYDCYSQPIAACDAQIQQHYSAMKPRWQCSPDVPVTRVPTPRRKKRHKNSPPVGVEVEIIRITGVDIAAGDGMGAGLAQTILSEIGTDLSQWPNEKQFTAWLGVAPRNDISGGRVLRSRVLPTRKRAGQAFRQAATAVSNSPSAFGAFYRRKRAQGGPLHAPVATANKIARTVYHMLKYHVQYQDMGAEEFERRYRERDLTALRQKATSLGCTLVEAQSVQATT